MKRLASPLIAGLAAWTLAAPALAIVPMDWSLQTRPYPVLTADAGGADPFRLDCWSAPGRPLHITVTVTRHEAPTPVPASDVRVESGRAQTTQHAAGAWDQAAQGIRYSVLLPVASPVLTEFARTGELAVRALDDVDVYPQVPHPLARRFVAACRARSR